jgi:hypothetical protein
MKKQPNSHMNLLLQPKSSMKHLQLLTSKHLSIVLLPYPRRISSKPPVVRVTFSGQPEATHSHSVVEAQVPLEWEVAQLALRCLLHSCFAIDQQLFVTKTSCSTPFLIIPTWPKGKWHTKSKSQPGMPPILTESQMSNINIRSCQVLLQSVHENAGTVGKKVICSQ